MPSMLLAKDILSVPYCRKEMQHCHKLFTYFMGLLCVWVNYTITYYRDKCHSCHFDISFSIM